MDTPNPSTTSLNVPSVVIFAILSFFAVRYFFFSSSTTTSTGPSSLNNNNNSNNSSRRTVPADRVEQVVVMFPQLRPRDIEWDLLRNGMSVQATTERVLREGRLPAAPPNFRASSSPSNASPITATTSSANTTAQQKPSHPDLITRYNLASRVANDLCTAAEEEQQPKGRQAWSANKNERETLLKRRRDEMVLQARRKMEAKTAGKGKAKEGL